MTIVCAPHSGSVTREKFYLQFSDVFGHLAARAAPIGCIMLARVA